MRNVIAAAFLCLNSSGIALAQTTSDTALAGKALTVALIGDDQAVSAAGYGVLLLTSDNTTATNRTFTLTASPLVGHKITLIHTEASDLCELADTGIQKLTAGFTCAQYDTLTLVSDGTNWIEVARADN